MPRPLEASFVAVVASARKDRGALSDPVAVNAAAFCFTGNEKRREMQSFPVEAEYESSGCIRLHQ
jgi:hypothetical protein